jgi:hypothetical protein
VGLRSSRWLYASLGTVSVVVLLVVALGRGKPPTALPHSLTSRPLAQPGSAVAEIAAPESGSAEHHAVGSRGPASEEIPSSTADSSRDEGPASGTMPSRTRKLPGRVLIQATRQSAQSQVSSGGSRLQVARGTAQAPGTGRAAGDSFAPPDSQPDVNSPIPITVEQVSAMVAGGGPEDVQTYARVVREKMAGAGIDLPMPQETLLDKVNVVFGTFAGRRSPVANIYCRGWRATVDRATCQVLSYSDYATSDAENNRYEELSKEGDTGLQEYEKPRMSPEEALAALLRRDVFGAFAIDSQSVAFDQPEISFQDYAGNRGWMFVFWRTYKGYRFKDDFVRFVINDGTGQLTFFENFISEFTPPDPVVNVRTADVASTVASYFAGASATAEKLRAAGYAYDPKSLSISPAQYVHAYDATPARALGLIPRNQPLILGYTCQLALDSQTGTSHLILYVDAQTGQILGGDELF